MTKKELLKLLEPFDDAARIGAYWDDCQWPIHRVLETKDSTEVWETGEFDVLIDCS